MAGYRIALAEAGIPFQPELVKYGEFRAISGERLTHQLLNGDVKPTAIFAANNAIAMGVIDALDARGLRIPSDIALVCFDDLPNTSRLFPFLTVVVQPSYDIGANAAQMLFSRLDSAAQIPARHVVLPTRMVVRHSCGAWLGKGGTATFRRNSTFRRTNIVRRKENLPADKNVRRKTLPKAWCLSVCHCAARRENEPIWSSH